MDVLRNLVIVTLLATLSAVTHGCASEKHKSNAQPESTNPPQTPPVETITEPTTPTVDPDLVEKDPEPPPESLPKRSNRDSQRESPVAPAPEFEEKSVENLLKNPGFEDGPDPWWAFVNDNWTRFEVDGLKPRTGQKSLHLSLVGRESEQEHLVAGALQELELDRFPDFVSGYYYVDHWDRACDKQYIQMVAIVLGDEQRPGWTNHQIRYPLAGIDVRPFRINNARFMFLGTDEPETGKWIHFQRDLAADFQEAWGSVPAKFEALRIYFEVRYDEAPTAGAHMAEVYFDDITLGYKR
jgi:hypothetical protein